jgi:DNA (cytosine-5)-methyltransferase 1
MPAYYNEIDPFAAAWLRNLIANGLIAPGDVDERDIREVQADDVRGYTQCHFFAGIGGWSYALRLAEWDDDRYAWSGSCPCQPLSVAGQQRGHADSRHLWPAFYDLIAQCRPSVVFGEQVASKHGREWFAAVRADLEGLGYACGGADLCAAGVGAPQLRQRLFFVAHSHRDRAVGDERNHHNPQWDAPATVQERQDKFARSYATGADGRGASGWEPEPTVARLVDGVSAELDHVRAGLANAIVPQVAEAFIRAYLGE